MKKNIFKKIVASLATVAMAAGLFTAMPAEEAKAAEEATKYAVNVTVKGEKADEMVKDGKLNLYYWGDGTVVSAPGWPGNAMTKNDDGSWSLKDIAVTGKFNLIVNGNGQTVDVKDVNVKKDIYVTVGAKEGEKYTATVTYGTEDAPEFKGEIVEPEKKDVKVYVKLADELGWSDAGFYYWGSGLSGEPGWPGTTLTAEEGVLVCTIKVEKSITTIGGIVNGGGAQTDDINDISVSTGSVYITVKADKTFEVATSKPASWTPVQDDDNDPTTGANDPTTGKNDPTTGKNDPTTKAPETTTEAKKGIEVEVTLSADAKWDKVFIYAFPEGEGLKAWPGVEMTAKDGKWYATLDTTATKLSYVISNGNGEQTVDVKDVEGKNVKITLGAKNAEGKFEASAKAVTAGGTGSAKPGDAAPIVMMFAVAAVAAGMVVASKKKTICE